MKKDASLRDELAVERTRLANERTFLAYVRTALALLAGGVALVQFFPVRVLWLGLAWFLMLSGVAILAVGVRRFFQVKKRYETKR